MTYAALQELAKALATYPAFWAFTGAIGLWIFWLPWDDKIAGGVIFTRRNLIAVPIIGALISFITLVLPYLSWQLLVGIVATAVCIVLAVMIPKWIRK